jgi:ribosomal protein L16 Arg81 hydroxylase
LNFYEQIKSKNIKSVALECICEEGELLFVPNRWWHSVINLEDSIAITQNFVNEQNLPNVIDFIKNKRELVSGYSGDKDLYEDFIECLDRVDDDGKLIAIAKSVTANSVRKTIWQKLKDNSVAYDDNSEKSTGFAFVFV